MRRTKEGWMYQALRRVITESGWAPDPRYRSAELDRRWAQAKTRGYIRELTEAEEMELLRFKRAVRTVCLAELNIAAQDEELSVYYENEWRPSVADHADKLNEVCSEIESLNEKQGPFWTLTEAGLEWMTKYEREELN